MKNVGIFLFDDMELLDFAGPYEVFSVTAELHDNQFFRVFSIGETDHSIRTVNGLRITPDYGFSDHPAIDLLIIPGGVGTKMALQNAAVLDWIKKASQTAQITLSICSGSRLLGQLGLLDGREYITHHEVIADMQRIAPRAILRENQRFTVNGNILTSAGISAGIDLSLHVVAQCCGQAAADRTAVYMEYGEWQKLLPPKN